MLSMRIVSFVTKVLCNVSTLRSRRRSRECAEETCNQNPLIVSRESRQTSTGPEACPPIPYAVLGAAQFVGSLVQLLVMAPNPPPWRKHIRRHPRKRHPLC